LKEDRNMQEARRKEKVKSKIGQFDNILLTAYDGNIIN
jgi:hypothetical protein